MCVARRLRAARGRRPGLALVERSVAEQRPRAVLAVQAGATVSAIARQVGVCRQTVQAWVARYAQAGPGGLVDRSGRPDSLRHQLSAELKVAIWPGGAWSTGPGPQGPLVPDVAGLTLVRTGARDGRPDRLQAGQQLLRRPRPRQRQPVRARVPSHQRLRPAGEQGRRASTRPRRVSARRTRRVCSWPRTAARRASSCRGSRSCAADPALTALVRTWPP
jgi:Helix-turn-helix domain